MFLLMLGSARLVMAQAMPHSVVSRPVVKLQPKSATKPPVKADVRLGQSRIKSGAKTGVHNLGKPSTKSATKSPIKSPTAPPPTIVAPVAPPPPEVSAVAASATVPPDGFGVGTHVISVGVGVGSTFGYNAGLVEGKVTVSPAVTLFYEQGLTMVGTHIVGVAAGISYQRARSAADSVQTNYSSVAISLRGAVHTKIAQRVDVYYGLGLGVRYVNLSYASTSQAYQDYPAVNSNYVNVGLFVGGRYFLSNNVGLFGELGYDQTYLKLGVAAKF